MTDLKRNLRKRRLLHSGALFITAGLVLAGLWGAKRLFPLQTVEDRHATRADPDHLPDRGIVEKVFDGDSCLLGEGLQVRLCGIDTPEWGQQGSDEARSALDDMIAGKEVSLRYEGKDRVDRYGRCLASVYTSEGLHTNEKLLSMGLAWIYRLDSRSPLWSLFLKTQQEAIEQGRGLWRHLSTVQGAFIGSRSSKVFHLPSCRHGGKISQKNRQVFECLREAFWQGFSPCRTCITRPLHGQ